MSTTSLAKDPFLTAPVAPTLARLAVPGIAAALIQSSMGVIEAYFVGRLGPVALASVALVFPIFMLATMLSAGAIGGAVSGATARALGAGDMGRAEAILRCALIIAVVGGASMSALMLGWGGEIYRFLGGSGPVLEGALAYGDILFSGIAALWLFNMTAAVIRGGGNLALPARTLALVTLIHLGLSTMLVAGIGPLPAMGLRGAALALVIAFAIGSAIHLCVLLRPGAQVGLHQGTWAARGVLKPLLKSGLMASTNSLMTVAIALMVTGMVGRLGTDVLAGYGIGVRLELLMVPIIFGVGSGSIAMVGANVGAGQRTRAIAIAWRAALASAVLVGSIGMVVAIHPPLWAALFTSNPEVAASTATYLRIVGPFYGFFALGLALYFASQGMDSLTFPALGNFIRLLFLAAAVGLLVATGNMSEQAMFIVVSIAMVIYGGFVAIALNAGPWKT